MSPPAPSWSGQLCPRAEPDHKGLGTKPSPATSRSLLPEAGSEANPTFLPSRIRSPLGFAQSGGLSSWLQCLRILHCCVSILPGQPQQSHSHSCSRVSWLGDPSGSPFQSPSLGRPGTFHLRQKPCLTNSLVPQIPGWNKERKLKKKKK